MDSEEELDMGDSPRQSLDAGKAEVPQKEEEAKAPAEQPDSAQKEEEKKQEEGGESPSKEEQKAEEVPSLTSYVPPPHEAPEVFSRPHIKKQPKLPKFVPEPPAPGKIPVLTPDTVRPDTYDLDYLQSTQKRVEATHRFLAPAPFPIERRRSLSPEGPDYVLRNIVNVREKSVVRANLDAGSSAAGILMSPKGKKATGDVKHLMEFRTVAEMKRGKLAEELKKKEMKECSFAPTILPDSAERPVRSADDYYQYMLQHQKRVEDKLNAKNEEMRSERDKEIDGYFHPNLCPESRKLDRASSEPRFERLYKLHRTALRQHLSPNDDPLSSTETSTSADTLFRPTINEHSHKLKRSMPVAQHLYQEAQERAQRQRTNAWSPKPTERLMSPGSQTLLVSKLRKELQEKWHIFEPEGNDLTYTKFVKLLAELWLLENSPGSSSYERERNLALKAWEECGGADDKRVKQSDLEDFLLKILYFSDTKEGPSDKTTHLRTVFRPLYERRMERVSKQERNPKPKEQFSFHPTITEETEGRRRNVVDILWEDASKRKQRLRDLAEKVHKETLKECVFAPTTNKNSDLYIGNVEASSRSPLSQAYVQLRQSSAQPGEALYRLAAIKQERRKQVEKKPEDREVEMHMVHCTFTPDLTMSRETYVKSTGNEEEYWGVESTVDRMKKAREDARRNKIMKERGYVHREDEGVFYFDLDHPHKLEELFAVDSALEKKVGKPGRRHVTLRSSINLAKKAVPTESSQPPLDTSVSQHNPPKPKPAEESKARPQTGSSETLPTAIPKGSVPTAASKGNIPATVTNPTASVDPTTAKPPGGSQSPTGPQSLSPPPDPSARLSPVQQFVQVLHQAATGPMGEYEQSVVEETTTEVVTEVVTTERIEKTLNFEVDISDTEKATITYHKGEDVDEVVRAFAVKHGLEEAQVLQLIALVKRKVLAEEA